MKAIWLLLLALLLIGCASEAPAPKEPPKTDGVIEASIEKKSPLYEQLSSGMFQADAAVKKIADALDVIHEMHGKADADTGKALAEMVLVLDDAGALLAAEAGGEAPTEDEVKKDEAKFQDKRGHLITIIDDTLNDLREQEGVAAGLSDMGPPELKQSAAKLDGLLSAAIDDLIGSLEALQGK